MNVDYKVMLVLIRETRCKSFIRDQFSARAFFLYFIKLKFLATVNGKMLHANKFITILYTSTVYIKNAATVLHKKKKKTKHKISCVHIVIKIDEAARE